GEVAADVAIEGIGPYVEVRGGGHLDGYRPVDGLGLEVPGPAGGTHRQPHVAVHGLGAAGAAGGERHVAVDRRHLGVGDQSTGGDGAIHRPTLELDPGRHADGELDIDIVVTAVVIVVVRTLIAAVGVLLVGPNRADDGHVTVLFHADLHALGVTLLRPAHRRHGRILRRGSGCLDAPVHVLDAERLSG